MWVQQSRSSSVRTQKVFPTFLFYRFLWPSPFVKHAHQLWYLFGSRNHRVYPICREEAVRLLRSTRMARAYSEGAYSSDFDYERYWHAPASCGLPEFVPGLFLFYPWSVNVMTENDICLISVFVKKSSQLWSCWCKTLIHNCLCVTRFRALYVSLLSAVGILVVEFITGDLLTVSTLMSLFMYIIPAAVCWSVVCVVFGVVLFYMLFAAAYCTPVQWHLWCIALGCTVAL